MERKKLKQFKMVIKRRKKKLQKMERNRLNHIKKTKKRMVKQPPKMERKVMLQDQALKMIPKDQKTKTRKQKLMIQRRTSLLTDPYRKETLLKRQLLLKQQQHLRQLLPRRGEERYLRRNLSDFIYYLRFYIKII